MRHILKSLTIAATLIGTGLSAQNGPVVVELFTSQGCSSCPPADAILEQLALRDDVIALALHVDYWDYIGWADEFADPAFTIRQKGYAHAAGADTIYTPQMVIDGLDHVIGSRPMDVVDTIQAHLAQSSDVSLSIARNGDTLAIDAATTGETAPMVVQLVRYMPQAKVAIGRGENAGQEILYVNIVNSWQVLTDWDGSSALDIDATVTGADPVVVLVQRGTDGPILAAAQLR